MRRSSEVLLTIATLVAFGAVISCRTPAPDSRLLDNPVAPPDYPDCAPDSCIHALSSGENFEELAGRVETSHGVSNIVKVVYRRDPAARAGKIYFMNTKTYAYHYDFVLEGLGLSVPIVAFNQNYAGTGAERRFNQASLVEGQIGDQAVTLVELWSGDTMDASYFTELFQAIRRVYQLERPLVFHPLSTRQEEMAKSLAEESAIRHVTTAELFAGMSYSALNRGTAVGYLAFAEEGACLDQSNIVVFDRVPNDVGLYSGVITAEFQTPLSHVNVKSVNRGTVNMVLVDAREKLSAYEGKPVRLVAGTDGYRIEILPESEAEAEITAFWNARRPSQRMRPRVGSLEGVSQDFMGFRDMFQGISTLSALRERHGRLSVTFGAKATNLALLDFTLRRYNRAQDAELRDTTSPDGLGISFAFFDEFMNLRQKGLDLANPAREMTPNERIREILAGTDLLDHTKFHSICKAKDTLAELREVILRSEVPAKMLEIFRRHLLTDETSPIHRSKVARIRLRSSTNSEDLPGFNGAGLYNSEGVSLYKRDDDDKWRKDEPKTWEKIRDGKNGLRNQIAYIYSSVWNDRAFEEREWFRMNGTYHLDVKVGIAVHQAFSRWTFDNEPGETANGVAVSTNIYQESDEPKLYVNAQHWDLAVTNPPTAEELEEQGEDPSKPYFTEEVLITPFLPDPAEDGLPGAWKRWSFERLSRSSVADGKPVLIDQPAVMDDGRRMEVRRLAKVLDYIDRFFAPVYGKHHSEFAIDTEWKTYGANRTLWMKQARPFDDGGDIQDGSPDGPVAFAPAPVDGRVARRRATVPLGPKPVPQKERPADPFAWSGN